MRGKHIQSDLQPTNRNLTAKLSIHRRRRRHNQALSITADLDWNGSEPAEGLCSTWPRVVSLDGLCRSTAGEV